MSKRWTLEDIEAHAYSFAEAKGVGFFVNEINSTTGETEVAFMNLDCERSGTLVSVYPNGSKDLDQRPCETFADFKKTAYIAIDHELIVAPSKKIPNAYRSMDIIDDVTFKKNHLATNKNAYERAYLDGFNAAAKSFKARMEQDIDGKYSTIKQSAEKAREKGRTR